MQYLPGPLESLRLGEPGRQCCKVTLESFKISKASIGGGLQPAQASHGASPAGPISELPSLARPERGLERSGKRTRGPRVKKAGQEVS